MKFEELRGQIVETINAAQQLGMHPYEVYGVIAQLEAEARYTMFGVVREAGIKTPARKETT